MCKCGGTESGEKGRENRFPDTWVWIVAAVVCLILLLTIILVPTLVLLNRECREDSDCGCPAAPLTAAEARCNYANYSMRCEKSCCQRAGVIVTPLENGQACGAAEVCQQGECVVEMCPGCRSDICQISTCDQGQCHSVPRNELMECHSDPCGNGVCRQGVCVVEPKCSDGNFCTLDRCHKGKCEFLPVITGDCTGFCLNGCAQGTACIDGLCMRMRSTTQSLKFVDHTFQECGGAAYRLVLHFRLFSSAWNASTGILTQEQRYLLPTSVADFSSVSTDLGFIDYVVEHQVRFIGGGAETSFSLATACIDLSTDNCHQVFALRDYEFNVMFHDCDEDLNCIDSVEFAGANMALSVNNCPLDMQEVVVEQVTELEVLGPDWSPTTVVPFDEYARVVLRTPGLNPYIRDARLCVPKNHRFRDCVLNKNATDCPARGCYGWGEDSPIDRFIDIFEDGWVTASVRGGTYVGTHIRSCRDFDHYPNMTCSSCAFQCCSPACDGCNNTDGFDFRLRDFLQLGDIGVFDLRFATKQGCESIHDESRAVAYLIAE